MSTISSAGGNVIDVAVPLPVDQLFTYRLVPPAPPSLKPGCRVVVPFGRRHLVGMVVGRRMQEDDAGLKEPIQVLDAAPLLSPHLLELGRWLSSYYFAPLGESIRIMLPPGLLSRRIEMDTDVSEVWPTRRRLAVVECFDSPADALPAAQRRLFDELSQEKLPVLASALAGSYDTLRRLERKGFIRTAKIEVYRSPWARPRVDEAVRHVLTRDQEGVVKVLRKKLGGSFDRTLLHGVTGSGKTEIYLNIIEAVLESGKTALMMVPEIGLTPQVARQFRSWFEDRVAILHSGLSAGERFDQWRRIRNGECRVVIGTRSAVFAPLENLALIIVDEEHDGSYKQEETPRYNGRDLALKRAQLEGALVILGSATPQLESYYRACSDKGGLLGLGTRILNRPLPAVDIVDMRAEFQHRGKAAVISTKLHDLIADRVKKKQQVLVLLNRRGYAASLLCRSCGHTEMCDNCSISLTFHQRLSKLLCHYCGLTRAVPAACPECRKRYLYYLGEGTEQIQELVQTQFPRARVDRLDRDAARRKFGAEKILEAFRDGETDILVGTQMIAKGHDFPRVTLVGVLAADQGLRLADFRAAERTFQLLTQVAGRAGRGEEPGRVVVQTYYPDHYSLKMACAQDYAAFYEHELRFRRRFRYPPFTALASLLIQSPDSSDSFEAARTLAQALLEARQQHSSPQRLRLLGPAPAAMERIRKDYRFQILIKTADRAELHEVVAAALAKVGTKLQKRHRVSVDIDPVNLL